ncbi:hypothetical protein FOPG_14505 [Fusarium oxysporum f. sp. conglutinans race 2 54008]|uniref:Uncharacterized protein n=1 Tax=Fusarium oxysporum f. sp. conglutinans race 2 54008 TaxID=1089457 RepID=X0HCJ1_FUSOX|nr:hypothetical protein FOPG_14505 [Fusarium oxysporum f. sp. conglutinans race 2 54008]
MSSIQKLIYHWKQGQFIPGGKPPQPLNNEVKEQRLSKLNSDDIIALEITKGISILRDAVEAFKKTQEFNKDPTSFIGDARDVLMSDDFLLLADVLRLIFPEGMISEVWQLKRGRDEDLDTQDDACAPGNRRIFMPISKRPRFTNGPKAQENKTQRENKARGLFKATGYTGIFGAKDKDSNNSPALQRNGIFSQRMSFASEKPKSPVFSEGTEKVSDTSPTPQYTGISGNKEEAIVDNLLSSMGADDVNKILAQLQLRQQGIKRKHEKEEETTNKKQINTQEPHSLI